MHMVHDCLALSFLSGSAATAASLTEAVASCLVDHQLERLGGTGWSPLLQAGVLFVLRAQHQVEGGAQQPGHELLQHGRAVEEHRRVGVHLQQVQLQVLVHHEVQAQEVEVASFALQHLAGGAEEVANDPLHLLVELGPQGPGSLPAASGQQIGFCLLQGPDVLPFAVGVVGVRALHAGICEVGEPGCVVGEIAPRRVVLLQRHLAVARVKEPEVRLGASHQAVRPNVKLPTLQQQRPIHVALNDPALHGAVRDPALCVWGEEPLAKSS
mmetsp:Transcript_70368/g.126829  ORF Transcript_70368/g.126829 Transcript_70368/m.126829 type:complete len:269 (+) Transcript_70368:259-1065(+)